MNKFLDWFVPRFASFRSYSKWYVGKRRMNAIRRQNEGVRPVVLKRNFKQVENAAKRGDPLALLILGDCYFKETPEKFVCQDYSSAYECYMKAAEAELAPAQAMVGWCTELSFGCESDSPVPESRRWYCAAAKNGSRDVEVTIFSKCFGCTRCQKVCPTGAISGKVKQVHSVDSDKCIRCGKCFDACPLKCISAHAK